LTLAYPSPACDHAGFHPYSLPPTKEASYEPPTSFDQRIEPLKRVLPLSSTAAEIEVRGSTIARRILLTVSADKY
jgi:hypothetical protein